jgi:cell division inhibitor SepF
MGAMYRLKAYFGMVPAEELGEYADDPLADRYPAPRRERSVRDYANERWDDRFSYEDESTAGRHDQAATTGTTTSGTAARHAPSRPTAP